MTDPKEDRDARAQRIGKALHTLWTDQLFMDVFGEYSTRYLHEHPKEIEDVIEKHKNEWCDSLGICPDDLIQ